MTPRHTTYTEAYKMVEEWRAHRTLWDHIVDVSEEPTPHLIYYDAYAGVLYVPPTEFYWCKNSSPSDCTWIVPGTLDWKI